MKRLFYVILLSLLLIGCGAAKKLSSSKQEATKYTETTTETGKNSDSFLIDTTKHSGTEITYTKIEFYLPEPKKELEVEAQKGTPTETRPNSLPNTGAIKSIEKLTIKTEKKEKGITDIQNSTEINRTPDISSESVINQVASEEPAADPYRWRYIFGILALVIILGMVGYFWLRKAGVFFKLVSFFKRIF